MIVLPDARAAGERRSPPARARPRASTDPLATPAALGREVSPGRASPVGHCSRWPRPDRDQPRSIGRRRAGRSVPKCSRKPLVCAQEEFQPPSPRLLHRRQSARELRRAALAPQGSLRLRAPATSAARRPSARHAAVHATRSGPMGTTGARRITGPAREFAGARLGRPRGSPALRCAFRPCAPPRWPRARARQSPARASCTSGPCRSRSSGSPPRSGHGWGP